LETIYFIGFCCLAAWLIYWMVKSDDYAEFSGDDEGEKFSVDPSAKERDQ